jgi:amino acid adenylation domain-containing protein
MGRHGKAAGMADAAGTHPGLTTLDLIKAQARVRAEATAILDGDRTLSYRELLTAARIRASELSAVAGPGDRVAIETGPGAHFAIGLLAAWLLGAVPVPTDPASPAQRRAYQLRQAGCVACLAAPEADGVAAEVTAEIRGRTRLSRPAPAAADIAYILFTSGTTGHPKGVQARHRGLTNLLTQGVRLLRLRSGRGMLAHSNPAFDMALAETLLPLAAGGTVVVAPDRAARDPERFAEWLRSVPVHAAVATPTLLRMLLPYLRGALHDCAIVSGGEALSADLAGQLHAVAGELWNGYGPTEATIAALFAPVRPPLPDPVPIGWPIAGVAAEILDDQQRPVPPGERGELCLSGIGLAAGYVNDPELTERAFGTGPTGNRIYRTGDVCSQRDDGQYDFRGRRDDQVKIRGHRIELIEIEDIAERSPSVARAVAVVCEPEAGRTELYLALLPSPSCAPDPAAVTAELRQQLPPYMVPARVVTLAGLPPNQAGKLDRATVRRQIDAMLRARRIGDAVTPPSP